jgi:hypothetical protein
MRRRSLSLLLLAAALAAGPALAEVLAEGKVKGGYYWQKVNASNGTRYLWGDLRPREHYQRHRQRT